MSTIKANNPGSSQKSYKPKEDFRYTKAQVDKIVSNLSSLDVSKRIDGNYISNTNIDYTDDMIIEKKTSKAENIDNLKFQNKPDIRENISIATTPKVAATPAATINIPKAETSTISEQKKPQQNLDSWLDGLLG